MDDDIEYKRESSSIDIGSSDIETYTPLPTVYVRADSLEGDGRNYREGFIKELEKRKQESEYQKKRGNEIKIASNILFVPADEHITESNKKNQEKAQHIKQLKEGNATIPFCHMTNVKDHIRHHRLSLENRPKNHSKKHIITPFQLNKFFGFNAEVFAKNMARTVEFAVLIATGNHVLIYDYNSELHFLLQGHRNRVVSTSIDGKAQWIASSDIGPDCSVIIWDASRCFPVHVIWEFNKTGCIFVKLSPCAKYLVTVCEDNDRKNIKIVSIWEWVHGKETPDVSVEIDTDDYGALKQIDICHAYCKFLMVTTEKQVIFLTFEIEVNGQKFLSTYYPKGLTKKVRKEIGIFNDSIYIKGSHIAVSGTTAGNAIIWSDKPWNFFEKEPQRCLSNKKNLFIQMKLDRYSIESIYSIDDQIVTLNSKGMILFYDQRFRVLYGIKELKGCSPAVNLSFHIKKRSVEGSAVVLENCQSEETRPNISTKVKRWEKLHKEEYCWGKPNTLFMTRDFIATTTTGDVVYVNHSHDEVKYILRNFLDGITAIDAHPELNLLCIGTDQGKLILYDFITKSIATKFLPVLEAATIELGIVCEEDRETVEAMSYVNYLKYSPTGQHVACGMKSGDVWLLNGSNIDPLTRITRTTYPIVKILFSKMNEYFVFYDSYGHMILMKSNNDKPFYMGKIRAHSKPISDVAFSTKDDQHYLYSLGLDNVFVEYHLNECDRLGFLKINEHVTIALLDHGVCLYPDPSSRRTMLMFTDTGKCRYINLEKMHIYRTVQAPLLQTAVRHFQPLGIPNRTEFLLFICHSEVGLLKCPVDGNPFKWLSHITASEKIEYITVSHDGKYMFCKGKNEYITMWEVNTIPLIALEAIGGKGTDPFASLLSLDPCSTTLQDIQDLFFYCQIAHKGRYTDKPYSTSDTIGACDVPSAFRALGYFMTDFEETLLIDELVGESGLKLTEIEVTFEKFIQIYVNHKVNRVSEPVMERAFYNLYSTIVPVNPLMCEEVPKVLLEDFIYFLEKFGDAFNPCMTYIYLRTLIKPFTKETEEEILNKIEVAKEFPSIDNKYYDFMPKMITYEYFKAVIMGLKEGFNETFTIHDESKICTAKSK